jgi:hypothetical protein
MAKVTFEGEDFRRMTRTDMAHVMRLVDEKKFGRHEVPFRDKTITIEIVRQETGILVKRIRMM